MDWHTMAIQESHQDIIKRNPNEPDWKKSKGESKFDSITL